MLVRRTMFAALLVSERKVEMHVGMRGHGSRRAPQVIYRLIELAQFFESAAQVVA